MEPVDGFGIEIADSTISVVGDLDANTAPRLDAAVDVLDEGVVTTLVIDMSEVDFVDSSGLRSLIRARQSRASRRAMVIRAPSDATMRLLEMTGLVEHFDIDDSHKKRR